MNRRASRALLFALSLSWTLMGCDAIERLFSPRPDSTPTVPEPSPGVTPVIPPAPQPPETRQRPQSDDPLLNRLAEQPLRITRHGECRMGCRHISRAEVEALLRTGRVNPSRTRHDGRCPSYAVEGRTDDGQQVRVVYADCPGETRIVTAIDLGRDWDCRCR